MRVLHRRHAAARALGWIRKAGGRAAKALIQALSDKTQPQPVREEAAESLAYLGYAGAIPALISVLDETDVRLRFWAVFALAALGKANLGLVAAQIPSSGGVGKDAFGRGNRAGQLVVGWKGGACDAGSL